MLVVADNTAGSVIVTLLDVVHPFASVITTVYVPADKFVFDALDPPTFHEYEYGAVPPEAVTIADPLLPPLHETLLDDMLAVSCVG